MATRQVNFMNRNPAPPNQISFTQGLNGGGSYFGVSGRVPIIGGSDSSQVFIPDATPIAPYVPLSTGLDRGYWQPPTTKQYGYDGVFSGNQSGMTEQQKLIYDQTDNSPIWGSDNPMKQPSASYLRTTPSPDAYNSMLDQAASPAGQDWNAANNYFDNQSFGNGPSTSPSWFDGMSAAGVSAGIDAFTGLGKLYFASEALGQQKKMNNFNIDLGKTNLANQAQAYNAQLSNMAENRAFNRYGNDPANTDQKDSYINQYVNQHKAVGTV